MATIDLGKIRFNWQGAYNNSTAYVINDVVSSGGNSYICKLASTGNAVSNGTYWDLMSQAGTNGTNGTDVGTVITTQGDVLYRDGSGLQKLGAGTSGQVLTTGGSGANVSWTTPSGGSWSKRSTNGSGSFSGTTLDLTGFTKTTRIHFSDLTPSANGQVFCARAFLAGSLISTSIHRSSYLSVNGSSVLVGTDTSQDKWRLNGGHSMSGSTSQAYQELTIQNPQRTTTVKTIMNALTFIAQDGESYPTVVSHGWMAGSVPSVSNALTGLRFYMHGGGNFVCDWVVTELNQ